VLIIKLSSLTKKPDLADLKAQFCVVGFPKNLQEEFVFCMIKKEVTILKTIYELGGPLQERFIHLEEAFEAQPLAIPRYAMNLIFGPSLRESITGCSRTSKTFICHAVFQTCEAVVFLHAQKPPIIQGDVHGGNILLDSSISTRLPELSESCPYRFREWTHPQPCL
jgi:serine/threonine protein kinase